MITLIAAMYIPGYWWQVMCEVELAIDSPYLSSASGEHTWPYDVDDCLAAMAQAVDKQE